MMENLPNLLDHENIVDYFKPLHEINDETLSYQNHYPYT